MAHSENSTMIQNYIAQYQKGAITLSGLWYNIQTPLHTLIEKEYGDNTDYEIIEEAKINE